MDILVRVEVFYVFLGSNVDVRIISFLNYIFKKNVLIIFEEVFKRV